MSLASLAAARRELELYVMGYEHGPVPLPEAHVLRRLLDDVVAAARVVPEGAVVVPREPTSEMIDAVLTDMTAALVSANLGDPKAVQDCVQAGLRAALQAGTE